MWFLFVGILAFLATYLLTGYFRYYALKNRLMDIPNERSSHEVPTPRGGGVAIALVLTVFFTALSFVEPDIQQSLLAIIFACAGICLVGLVDDHRHVSARWRLLVHFSGISLALVMMGGVPPIEVYDVSVEAGFIGSVLIVTGLVWLLNLFNFMDGIDGIASVETITSGLALAFLSWMVVPDSMIWVPPLFMACSVLGFLIWNFPPAKIFMGDAGSGFIGALLGLLAVHAAWESPVLLWCWVIMLAVFVVDASVTLARRLIALEPVYKPHRSHAYQNASRLYRSHLPVTLGVAGINVVFLFPIAFSVATGLVEGVVGVVIAYVPLCFIALYLKSGVSEEKV